MSVRTFALTSPKTPVDRVYDETEILHRHEKLELAKRLMAEFDGPELAAVAEAWWSEIGRLKPATAHMMAAAQRQRGRR